MSPSRQNTQSGNILFFILIGIVLIGAVTFALRDSGGLNGSVDNENATVKAAQIIKYGGELSTAVNNILANGASETDLRFAYNSANASYGNITVNPQYQVFSQQGGRAVYRAAPTGTNDGSAWEFMTDYAALQQGSGKADLLALLTYVNDNVCTAINNQLGIASITSNNCVVTPTRFAGTYSTSPITPSYSPVPSGTLPQACIKCDYGAGVTVNAYFTTLLAR